MPRGLREKLITFWHNKCDGRTDGRTHSPRTGPFRIQGILLFSIFLVSEHFQQQLDSRGAPNTLLDVQIPLRKIHISHATNTVSNLIYICIDYSNMPKSHNTKIKPLSPEKYTFLGFLRRWFSHHSHVVWQDLCFQLLRAHLRFPGPLRRGGHHLLPSASRGALVCTNCLSSASQNQLERSDTHTQTRRRFWKRFMAHFMAEGKACPFDIWWWLISMASHIGGWVPPIT